MFQIVRSSHFEHWLRNLHDPKGKARILARLRSAAFGHFGDCKSIGDGVSEMRIHTGPGYRIYFMRTDAVIYVMLTGGDKDRQQRDIQRAKEIAQAWRRDLG
jgi:putative addiction module killer protein